MNQDQAREMLELLRRIAMRSAGRHGSTPIALRAALELNLLAS